MRPETRSILCHTGRSFTAAALVAAALAALLVPDTAPADTSTCFRDERRRPLRRVYVTHWLETYQTDEEGCLTMQIRSGPSTGST